MTYPGEGEAASREMLEQLRDAAESRLMTDPLPGLVPDADGGDPIPWDDEQREVPRAPEHRRH